MPLKEVELPVYTLSDRIAEQVNNKLPADSSWSITALPMDAQSLPHLGLAIIECTDGHYFLQEYRLDSKTKTWHDNERFLADADNSNYRGVYNPMLGHAEAISQNKPILYKVPLSSRTHIEARPESRWRKYFSPTKGANIPDYMAIFEYITKLHMNAPIIGLIRANGTSTGLHLRPKYNELTQPADYTIAKWRDHAAEDLSRYFMLLYNYETFLTKPDDDLLKRARKERRLPQGKRDWFSHYTDTELSEYIKKERVRLANRALDLELAIWLKEQGWNNKPVNR